MNIYRMLFVILIILTYGAMFWALPLAVEFSPKEIAELHVSSVLCAALGYLVGYLAINR